MDKIECKTFTKKHCTLSEESQKTLHVYKIRIPKTELDCINKKNRYYMLKKDEHDMKNIELSKLINDEQNNGYSYIFSEVCWDLPFHPVDYCCYTCREWFGCEESKNVVYLWFWKKINETDIVRIENEPQQRITTLY
jgi:hypothetical protein